MREFRLYLMDIVSAITSIENFVQGMDNEAFKAEPLAGYLRIVTAVNC